MFNLDTNYNIVLPLFSWKYLSNFFLNTILKAFFLHIFKKRTKLGIFLIVGTNSASILFSLIDLMKHFNLYNYICCCFFKNFYFFSDSITGFNNVFIQNVLILKKNILQYFKLSSRTHLMLLTSFFKIFDYFNRIFFKCLH